MYRKDVYPASRAEAYNMMAHMAQDMCNEVDYSEQLKIENKQLREELENTKKKFEDSQTLCSRYYSEKQYLRDEFLDCQKKYYELLKECRPDEYKMIHGEESDDYEYDERE